MANIPLIYLALFDFVPTIAFLVGDYRISYDLSGWLFAGTLEIALYNRISRYAHIK